MAPEPPRHTSHVVDCPPSRHVGSRGQATPAPRQELKPACGRKLRIFLWVLLAAAVITGFVLMCVFLARGFPTGDPVFTVAVAGVASLDPVRDGGTRPPAPLSPVFNLTFHIDNKRNSEYRACVPGLSSAAVSYGDAFLGKGSVPPFCAKEKHESVHMVATAWGDGVVLPRFLRDKLAGDDELAAGEAPSVDVKVTMPGYCSDWWCFDAVLTCKAKIGGGPSPPCRLDSVHTHDGSQGEDDDTPVVIYYVPSLIPGMSPLIPIFT